MHVCVYIYIQQLSAFKSKMYCALSQVDLGQGLSSRQRLREWRVGRKTISGPTNSLSHPPLTQAYKYEQLWGDYIQLKSICWPVEWSAVGP